MPVIAMVSEQIDPDTKEGIRVLSYFISYRNRPSINRLITIQKLISYPLFYKIFLGIWMFKDPCPTIFFPKMNKIGLPYILIKFVLFYSILKVFSCISFHKRNHLHIPKYNDYFLILFILYPIWMFFLIPGVNLQKLYNSTKWP